MLPFLKRKNEGGQTGVIVKTRQPDENPSEDQNDPEASLEACGRDICSAIERKDYTALSRAILDLIDSNPAESAEPHSYDAQNEKAAENE